MMSCNHRPGSDRAYSNITATIMKPSLLGALRLTTFSKIWIRIDQIFESPGRISRGLKVFFSQRFLRPAPLFTVISI